MGKDTFDYLRSWSSSTKYFRADEVNLKGYDAPVPTWSISFMGLREFLNTAADESTSTVEWE